MKVPVAVMGPQYDGTGQKGRRDQPMLVVGVTTSRCQSPLRVVHLLG